MKELKKTLAALMAALTIFGTALTTPIAAEDNYQAKTETAAVTAEQSEFYFLKTPTSDPASNDTAQWGSNLGTGSINTANASWTNNKNCFVSDSSRVISWPEGYANGTVSKGSKVWNTIVDAYIASIKTQYPDRTISSDDIKSITLVPYKISKNNGTTPDKHVDCTVKIDVKGLYTATYYLEDAGTTGYTWQAASNIVAGNTTSLTSALANLPETKIVNDRTYQFVGWYDNAELSGSKVEFPYTMNSNMNFYAKYTENYYVNYNLDGGSWTNDATRYTYAPDTTVSVNSTVPTKTGYSFAGWTYSENGNTYKSNDTIAMPENDVTFTAKWIANKVKLTFRTSDGSEIITKEGNYGDSFTAGVDDSGIAFDTAKNILKRGSYAGITVQMIDAALSTKDLEALGFTFTFDGWTTESQNLGEFVAKGSSMHDLGVVYSTETASNKFTGETETVYAHYAVAYRKNITIQVSGKNNIDEFNGYAHTTTGYDATLPDGVTGISVSLKEGQTATASRTEVGTTYMGLTSDMFEVTGENADNYNVTIVIAADGYQKITPVAQEVIVKIIGKTASNEYDGTGHTAAEYKVEKISNTLYTADDFSFSGNATASRTEVGTTNMGLTAAQFANTNKNFSKVTFVVTDGSQEITPANVTVQVQNDGKVYGNADPKFSAKVTGLVKNESSELIKYSIARSNAGTDEEAGIYTDTIIASGDELQGNYKVTYVPADFTITASTANAVFATDYIGTYDGSAHSITAKATQNGSILYYSTDNQTWSETLPEFTDAAETRTVYIKAVNPNYEDAFGQAEVTINKRNVTLTSGTSAKRYDGTALTNENVLVSGDGFAEGEGAEYTVTGTQTEKGSSDNTFTYTMNEGTNADNYNVTVINGTLTVADRPVTPIAPDEPETPVTPTTPEEPARPVTPVTPDEPEATETPAATETPTTAENEETAAAVNRPHTPNTGDATNSGLAAGVFGFAILAAGLAFFLKKKYTD
jgi:uncharacterized repeat protein (TIGR02543 family)/LPXTG-motif cell wall-anchored protein